MNPHGVAVRLKKLPKEPSTTVTMETVICGKCGQQFAIRHDPALREVDAARKQALWVTDELVWDHIQERKHRGTIGLPNCKGLDPASDRSV